MPRREALLIDFGGVLTTSVFESFAAFCAEEGLAPDHLARAFGSDTRARELLFALELGQVDPATFEREFAAALDLDPARADGIVGRLFARTGPDEPMLAAVVAARRAGVRTGLISNSWGEALQYDRDRFGELFDAVVISHEVGLRKPDPAIYALAASRVGVAPEACVFVDDIGGNLKPARAMGMATVKHTSADATIPELEALLGVALR